MLHKMPDMEFYTDDRDKSEEYVGHVKVAYSGGVSRSRGGGGGRSRSRPPLAGNWVGASSFSGSPVDGGKRKYYT